MKCHTIQDHLDIDDLLGCIKWKNSYHFYMSDITLWILNYAMYDPGSVEHVGEFKNGILNVDNNSIAPYLEYASSDKINTAELVGHQQGLNREDKIYLYFFIDFDSSLYVNAFPDISIEEYLPNSNWIGKYEAPVDHLPIDLQHMFR